MAGLLRLGTPTPVLHQGQMTQLVFLPGSQSLVALSWDHVCSGNTAEDRALDLLRIWDLKTERVAMTASDLGTITSIGVATSANRIAMLTMDGQLSMRVLDPFTSEWSTNVGDVVGVSVPLDGKHVLVGDVTGTLWMFDGATGQLQWTEKVLEKYVVDAAFSPSGRYFAVGGTEELVSVFDGRTRAKITSVATAVTNDVFGGIYALAFSSDDNWLATAGADHVLRVFSLPSGKLKISLKPGGYPRALAWSPDNTLLACAGTGDDGAIKLVKVADGSVVQLRTKHTGMISALAWSPDGALIASGARDDTIWASSPDGAQTASTARDDTIRFTPVGLTQR